MKKIIFLLIIFPLYGWCFVSHYHYVKKGETLFTISKKYGVPVEELKTLNNLKSSVIFPGQRLLIKRYDDEWLYYTVKNGDTLWKISRRYRVPIPTLKKINNLKNDCIRPGERLKIKRKKINTSNYRVKRSPIFPSNLNNVVVEEALSYLNTPYKFGGRGKNGIDCSSLIKLVYRKVGINLPNTSYLQYRKGIPVKLEEAEPGDVVFFRINGRISHVGIYLGNKLFIHASSKMKKVTISSLENSYFRRHFAGIKRYLPQKHILLVKGD